MNTEFKPLNKKELAQKKPTGVLAALIAKLSNLFTESGDDISDKRLSEIEREISKTEEEIRDIFNKN